MDLHALALAMAITNIVGDLLVLLAPFPIVWGLHASRARRLAVVGIFLLGGLVCVVSIVRIPYLGGVFAFDATWEGFPAAVMSVIEPAVGLVCACLPTMMPFFRSCRRAGTRTTRTPNTGSPGQSWGSKPPRLHLTYLSYLAKKGPGGSKSTGMTSSGTQEGSTAWKGESESRLTIP
ncbi:MAG: hypothetical protein M1823_000041 [Watsoniomyces obsoletus]|nr:MAG: hypothetical protein M1823_000041 [Watsoniomyces obsoletus]